MRIASDFVSTGDGVIGDTSHDNMMEDTHDAKQKELFDNISDVHRLSYGSNSNSDSNSNQKSWTDENEDRLRQRSVYDLNAAKSFNEKMDNNKMTGYLEKRSKMLGWKRFWFVLDGRLLTYFKSKSDYESLSPFQGSINLGIATHVSPIKASKGFPFQIVTRTQVYYLRVLVKFELDRWLIAIQEAATIPPNISLPVWADSGIQFYRYSFTAVSQWSLSASTEDLTNSKTLPLNFYRPSSLLKKCHSFASLNFNGKTSHTTNNKKTSSTAASALSQNNHQKLTFQSSPFTYSNSDKDFREMQEIIPRNKNIHNMRQTTSMLVLESSAQAGELRRELAQKLSTPAIPTLRPRLSSNNIQEDDETGQPQMIFPKTLRSYNQQQQNLPSIVGGTHLGHSSIMYTNTSYQSSETATDVNHEYDEIAELDRGIYEPVQGGSPITSYKDKRTKKTESIYENVENQNQPLASVTAEDPWERLPNFNKTAKNTSQPLAMRTGVGPDLIPPRNRRSLQHRESNGRNSLGSIAEIPEKESSSLTSTSKSRAWDTGPNSNSFDCPSTPPMTMTTTTFPPRGGTWDSRSSDKEGEEHDGKKKKKRQMKKGSISRFLQKIFTKSDGGKRRDGDESRDMVITGPVDLRKPSSEFSSTERLSRNNSGKSDKFSKSSYSDQAKGQGHHLPSRSLSGSEKSRLNMTGSKPAIGSSLISSDKLLEELNQKIGQMKRSDGQSYGLPTVGPRERRSIRKSSSHQDEHSEVTSSIGATESNRTSLSSYSVSSSIGHSRSASHGNASSLILSESTHPGRSSTSGESEEFLKKLARFNRLSASLNQSFVAALSNSHSGGGSMPGSKIGRSYSCRVRFTEEPPVLPPKRKQCPLISVYDVPKNNSPVIQRPTRCDSSSMEKQLRSSTLREFTKKSSAPDISFSMTTSSSSTSGSTSSEPSSLLRKSLLESQEQVFSDEIDGNPHESCKAMMAPKPPPRPPKVNQTNSNGNFVLQFYEKSFKETKFKPDETIQKDEIKLVSSSDDIKDDDHRNKTDGKLNILTEQNDTKVNLQVESSSINIDGVDEENLPKELNVQEVKCTDEIKEISLEPKIEHSENFDQNEQNCVETEKTELESLTTNNHDEIVEQEVITERDSCIQCSEILEAPVTSLATLEIFEQSNKSTLKYIHAPFRHHAEILEIPDLLKLNFPPPSSPTPSEGMDVLSDISNSTSPPMSPLEGPPDNMAIAEITDEKKINHSDSNTTLVIKSQTEKEDKGHLEQTKSSSEDTQETLSGDFQEDQSTKLNVENNEQILKPLVDQPLDIILDDDDGSHLYDDVPFETVLDPNKVAQEELPTLNYAVSNSVAWETVEETEEEVYELYDHFPADDYIISATAIPKTTTEIRRVTDDQKSQFSTSQSVIRHSGIDQLQAFLAEEMNNDASTVGRSKFDSVQNQKSRGAVNRLGHSSAVEQLKQAIGHSNE